MPHPGDVLRRSGRVLRMGTDIEDVFATRMMVVYKPTPSALETIVNYVDPDRRKKAEEEAKLSGSVSRCRSRSARSAIPRRSIWRSSATAPRCRS